MTETAPWLPQKAYLTIDGIRVAGRVENFALEAGHTTTGTEYRRLDGSPSRGFRTWRFFMVGSTVMALELSVEAGRTTWVHGTQFTELKEGPTDVE